MKFKTATITLLTLLLLSPEVHSAVLKKKLRTGVYGESLILAVNSKDANVSGKFSSSGGYLGGTGWDCNFYFSGKMQEDGDVKIVATSFLLKKDEERTSTTGTIIPLKTSEDAVIIKLDEDVSGCSRGEDLLEEMPTAREFNELRASLEPRELQERRDGIEYRIVSAKKTFFFDSASCKDHRKAYVTCGDVVMVTEKNVATGRVKVSYEGKKLSSEGWLIEADLLKIGEALKCPR